MLTSYHPSFDTFLDGIEIVGDIRTLLGNREDTSYFYHHTFPDVFLHFILNYFALPAYT
jgi:hypothetical protein